MNPDRPTLGTQVNTDLAKLFAEIVTAGWATTSDGHVDAPTGHFALILIEPNELKDLIEAVFEDGFTGPTIYPGSYILTEDSDGNKHLTEFLTHSTAQADFDATAKVFTEWVVGGIEEELVSNPWDPKAVIENRPEAVSTYEDPVEKLYLVCANCGEAFDEIKAAQEHGTADLSGSAGWCGDEGFFIQPESEAM